MGNLPKFCIWSKISHLKSKSIFRKYLHSLVSLSFFVQKMFALLNVKKKKNEVPLYLSHTPKWLSEYYKFLK